MDRLQHLIPTPYIVVPAEAGTQERQTLELAALGPRLRVACAGATKEAAGTICPVRISRWKTPRNGSPPITVFGAGI